MQSFKEFLMESHPKGRADRRRETAKPDNDLREKIKKIEKTMGTLSDKGQEELKRITNNFSKWPGEGRIKRLFNNMGAKKANEPPARDIRKMPVGSDD